MDHYKGISENERYNNDLLNEIRKTNQLLERLILPIKTEVTKPTVKKTIKTQTKRKVR